MKRFNLEEYLKNPSKKVVTREGRNARIVCTDFKTIHKSVLALVDYGEYECVISCSEKGKHYTGERESPNDLFVAPEKHEGWLNLYKNAQGYVFPSHIYQTKEDAEKYGIDNDNYITTIKIEWEE